MKQYKVVVLDCDGVLFDTEKANKAYYNKVLKHLNQPVLTPAQFEYCHMHTVDESLAFLFPDNEKLEVAQAFRKKMGYHEFIPHMEIEPTLVALLKKLRTSHKTAIATNRTDTMQRVLSYFSIKEDFDLVVTALDVAHPKPAPDQLVKVTDHFNTRCDELLYIGDSKLDELAAINAAVPFVAYKNPDLQADYHIQSLRQIEDIIYNASKN